MVHHRGISTLPGKPQGAGGLAALDGADGGGLWGRDSRIRGVESAEEKTLGTVASDRRAAWPRSRFFVLKYAVPRAIRARDHNIKSPSSSLV